LRFSRATTGPVDAAASGALPAVPQEGRP